MFTRGAMYAASCLSDLDNDTLRLLLQSLDVDVAASARCACRRWRGLARDGKNEDVLVFDHFTDEGNSSQAAERLSDILAAYKETYYKVAMAEPVVRAFERRRHGFIAAVGRAVSVEVFKVGGQVYILVLYRDGSLVVLSKEGRLRWCERLMFEDGELVCVRADAHGAYVQVAHGRWPVDWDPALQSEIDYYGAGGGLRSHGIFVCRYV
jgi:hypothetical protein